MKDTRASGGTAKGTILVAEDNDGGRDFLVRVLSAAGYQVTAVENGRRAKEILDGGASFDVIITDIEMPEMDGIQLLRAVRERDADVPVVLVTGSPDVGTAMEAVRFSALLYVTKPFDINELKRVVSRAVRLRRIARLKQEALALVGGGLGDSDRIGLEAGFDRMLESFWMAYQPIVRASDGSLYGYEALLRSSEKSLSQPGAILDAAERLDRQHELGRKLRAAAVVPMVKADPNALLFVNLHPNDLLDDNLFADDAPLSGIASRVILEITERATLDEVENARARIARLRRLGFRIAVDDLGAGYAGLNSFVTLEPEIVKLDMTLVRDIDGNQTKQKLVRSVTGLCKELGMLVVGEGVETRGERDVLIECGCDLLQGYLLARPDRPFPTFAW